MLHRGFDVARQVVYAQVADGDPEVVSGYVFEFVSFVKNHGRGFGQDAGVGAPSACNLMARSAKNR